MAEYASTNVRLPKDYIRLLKHRAVEEGKSMGEVLRNILTEALSFSTPAENGDQDKAILGNPFEKIAGLGESGVSDGATDHDT